MNAWEKRKLGSVFDYEQPTPYIVNSENYNDQYPTPVLTAGKSLVLGYTDENGGIKLASKHKPVIIFDDFTTSSHLIDFPFKVKSSAMKILSTSSDSDDVYFAFGLLSNLHYEPKNHERHWISQFSAFKVRTPPTTEQKRIGKTLLRIDDLIAATQGKLDCLERIKKALLQHLFDQSIRFKGYSDPWEKRKLGNISEIRTGPFGSVLHAKDYVNDGVPIITTEHFKSGALPTYKFNLPQVSAEDFRRLKSYNLQPGDVVFSRVGSVDVSAEVLPLQDGWLFSGRVLRVRPKESVSGAFLHYILSTTSIKRNIRSRAVGQTMPSINTKILNDTSIVLPHKTSEQNKISSALASLDSLIAATQSKLSNLETLKKALLQGLFI